MLRLRQASATTVHRIERALQRQPRANKNLGSRSVNSTTQDPDMSPTPARRLCGSCHGVASRGYAQLAAGGSRFGCDQPRQAHRCARRQRCEGRPWTARVRPRIGNRRRDRFRGRRHRIKVGHSGRFSISLPAGRYHAVGGIPRLGWKRGECYVDSPSPPAWMTWSRARRHGSQSTATAASSST
jgi:hypothetical protein